jgi:hypothetical protein
MAPPASPPTNATCPGPSPPDGACDIGAVEVQMPQPPPPDPTTPTTTPTLVVTPRFTG